MQRARVDSVSVWRLRTAGCLLHCLRIDRGQAPQAKACWFIATAAPFSSMARISDSNDSGTRPCCQA